MRRMRLTTLAALLLASGCSSTSGSADADDAAPVTSDDAGPDAAHQVRDAGAEQPDVAPSPPETPFAAVCTGAMAFCQPTLDLESTPLTWACFPSYGNRCTFRCDECPSDNDAGDGGCQIPYLSDAGTPCGQLGGHCVAAMGLDGGAVSLCEK